MTRYIDAEELRNRVKIQTNPYGKPTLEYESGLKVLAMIDQFSTADVVEVKKISEQIIRKKAVVSDYWQNDVKRYRAMQGYSDIEHDTDNFLRGYNEAVEDILAILDGTPKERGGEK